MDYVLIPIVAFLASCLTLFSGFGLGTLLLPVFGLFFPLEMAVAMTALVHFANNLFKLAFFRKNINADVVLKFGLPAIIFSVIGAYLLDFLSTDFVLFRYFIGARCYEVYLLKLVIGTLLIMFSLFEVVPFFKNLAFDKKYLFLGGMLSGFFGGLSGHQGALRSAFLIRSGLTKESFISTGVFVACMVDVSRLSVYSKSYIYSSDNMNYYLVCAAIFSAFLGVFLGNRFLQKTTYVSLQRLVAIFLFIYGVLIIAHLI